MKKLKKFEAKAVKNSKSLKGGNGKDDYNGSTISHETRHWLM